MERKHDIKTLQPKFFEWRSLFGFPTRVMSVNTWGCRKMFVFSMNHLSGQRQEIAAQQPPLVLALTKRPLGVNNG